VYHLGRVSPFAVVFGAYSILIDHLPDDWFERAWLRNAFAVLLAVVIGGLVSYAFQRPAVQRALAPEQVPAPVPAEPSTEGVRPPGAASVAGTHQSVNQVLLGTRTGLLATLQTAQRDGVAVRGWQQFLNMSKPPGAVGSAYGLRLALALDIHHPEVDRADIVRSILAVQHGNGGWAARSQRQSRGQPEITAFVLPALVRAGLATSTREALVATMERMLHPTADLGLALTTVVTVSLAALVEVAPASPRVPELVAVLARGAQHVPGGASLRMAWGEFTNGSPTAPSAPHTARAVVALRRVVRAGADRDGAAARCAAAGVEWLRHNVNYECFEEPVRRYEGEDTDVLAVGHFTPAWIARALLVAADDGSVAAADMDVLVPAVRAVLASQTDGIWYWHGGPSQPIWMTYQGVTVLREYAMRNLPWPP
jgi:hypothetical protein